MVKLLSIFLVMSSIFSCGLPSNRLNEGRGNKVPKENYVFKNVSRIQIDNFKEIIDINYFYYRTEYFESNKNYEVLNNRRIEDKNKLKLQFYENGRVRWGGNNPSPDINGHRGIIYFKDEQLFSDIFLGMSSGHNTGMNIKTFKIKIEQDTLLFLERGQVSGNTCSVFIKGEKIPEEYKKYNANW